VDRSTLQRHPFITSNATGDSMVL